MLTNTVLDGAVAVLQAQYTASGSAIVVRKNWPDPQFEPSSNRALLILHEGLEQDAKLGGGEGGLRGSPAGTGTRPGGDTLLATYLLPNPVEQGGGATYDSVQNQARADKALLVSYFKVAAVQTLNGTVMRAGQLITIANPQYGPFQASPLTDSLRVSWQASISVRVLDP